MDIYIKVIANYPYFVSVILFSIGCYMILSQSNLVKKVIGINIMESAIFLFFVAIGNIRGGLPPVLSHYQSGPDPQAVYINPLPSALVLTGIVVSLSVTAFALSIVVKLYNYYGTIETTEIIKLRSEG